MNTRTTVLLVTGMTLAVLAACSDSGSSTQATATQGSTSVYPSPSPSIDPEAAKALAAYSAFVAAVDVAQKNPVTNLEELSGAANFARYAYDPARAQELADLKLLVAYNAEFRGIPAESHVKLDNFDQSASPYPTATLQDCLVPQGEYLPYNKRTNKKLELSGDADLKEPYLKTVKMIAVKGRWGVKSAQVQQEGTCQP